MKHPWRDCHSNAEVLEVVSHLMHRIVRSRIGFVGANMALVLFLVALGAPKVYRAYDLGSTRHLEMKPLIQELGKRDIQFAMVVAPYRARSAFQKSGPGYKRSMRMQRSLLLKAIEGTGVPLIDLYDAYAGMADDQANFRDGFHVSEAGAVKLASAAEPKIHELAERLPSGRDKILIMGECYAVDLAIGLQSRTSGKLKIDALRSYDDAVRVADLLFRYEKTHLDGCGLVVWFLPDDLLWQGIHLHDFPPKLTDESRHVQVRAKVLTDVGFDYRTWDEVKPRLLYSNALGEIQLKIDEASPGVPDLFVGIQYCIREKKPTGFEGIKMGDTIVLSMRDADSYFSSHPQAAGEARFATVKDYLLPRFWIESWTKTAYTKGQW